VLCAHIWAGDDQHAARVIEAQVIGYEGSRPSRARPPEAPAVDQQHRFVDQFRLCAIQSSGALGEAVSSTSICAMAVVVDCSAGSVRQMIQQGLVQRLLRARARSRAPSTLSSKISVSGVMKSSADFTVWRRR